MGRNFWGIANEVIKEASILLEVIDARNVSQTRNRTIEARIKREGKVLIYVLNKCDLVEQAEMEKIKKTLNPCVFVSCKDYYGMTLLKERIMIEAKKLGITKPIVGVLGYPNMGKSSIINALSGTGKAKTSSISGFTRGKQHIGTRNFFLIDSPGVIPSNEMSSSNKVISGIKTDSKDPESDVLLVMQEQQGIIENYFGVAVSEDREETLEKIAVKLNCVKKGNLPDSIKAAQMILKLLRNGKIRLR